MNTYYVTYEVLIEVEANSEEEAITIADQKWWSDGEVTNVTIEQD